MGRMPQQVHKSQPGVGGCSFTLSPDPSQLWDYLTNRVKGFALVKNCSFFSSHTFSIAELHLEYMINKMQGPGVKQGIPRISVFRKEISNNSLDNRFFSSFFSYFFPTESLRFLPHCNKNCYIHFIALLHFLLGTLRTQSFCLLNRFSQDLSPDWACSVLGTP